MSWKMFLQIVLLLVIAALIMASVKCGMRRCKLGMKDKGMHHEMKKK